MSNFFYARIYEAVAKTSEYLSPEVVVIAGQLVKAFINSFRNAIMLLSKTPAKTETFGQNLKTVEKKKKEKYVYTDMQYI